MSIGSISTSPGSLLSELTSATTSSATTSSTATSTSSSSSGSAPLTGTEAIQEAMANAAGSTEVAMLSQFGTTSSSVLAETVADSDLSQGLTKFGVNLYA